MNPTLIAIALAIWIASVAGAWFYRGHVDAGDVVSAERAIAAESSQAALKAAQDAARDARALQGAADVRVQRLQERLDATHQEYAVPHAKVAACPIPVAAVSVLYAPVPSPDSGAKTDHPGPATSGAPSGTVDAAAIDANIRVNREKFDRNQARLQECIGQYDDIRTKVNGP